MKDDSYVPLPRCVGRGQDGDYDDDDGDDDGDDDDDDGEDDDEDGDYDDSYLCLASWAEGKPGYRGVPFLSLPCDQCCHNCHDICHHNCHRRITIVIIGIIIVIKIIMIVMIGIAMDSYNESMSYITIFYHYIILNTIPIENLQ